MSVLQSKGVMNSSHIGKREKMRLGDLKGCLEMLKDISCEVDASSWRQYKTRQLNYLYGITRVDLK